MGQDKNIQRTILEGIDLPAPRVYAQQRQVKLIPVSSLTDEQVQELGLGDLKYMRTRLNLSGSSDGSLALAAFSISLRLAARSVVRGILGFWNLIIGTRRRSGKPSHDTSPRVIPGVQKSSDVRFGNAVYFAPTATENIPSSNRITTAIQTYEERCKKYMTLTKSDEEYQRIKDGLVDGTLDPESITLAEFLHVSFLTLYDGDGELHIEPKLVYKGNVYYMHTCIQGVTPGQPVESLKKKV